MRFIYCPECGSKLEERVLGDDGLVPWCTQCDKPWFDMFSVAVIGAVVNEFGEIVTLHPEFPPTPYRTIVSGYVVPGESAEETMAREIKEEVGIEPESITIEGTHWFAKRGMMMVGFFAKAHKADFKLSKEIIDAAWTPAREAMESMHPAPATSHLLCKKVVEYFDSLDE